MLAIEAILKADTMWGEGRRGAGRAEKRKKTLAPAHRNQAVFCDTEKKRVVCSPAEVTQWEQIPSPSCCLRSSLFPYLRGVKGCLSGEDKQVKGFLFATSPKATTDLDLLRCLSDFNVKLLYLVQSMESSEKS